MLGFSYPAPSGLPQRALKIRYFKVKRETEASRKLTVMKKKKKPSEKEDPSTQVSFLTMAFFHTEIDSRDS